MGIKQCELHQTDWTSASFSTLHLGQRAQVLLL